MWERAGISHGESVEILESHAGDLPIDKDNYVDFCIVATPSENGSSSLSSDYIKIVAHTKGYSLTRGIATSKIISHDNGSMWEMLTWSDNIEENTEIKYKILYEDEVGRYIPIENEYLDGDNFNGSID